MFHIPSPVFTKKLHGQNELVIPSDSEQVGAVSVLLVGEKELLSILWEWNWMEIEKLHTAGPVFSVHRSNPYFVPREWQSSPGKNRICWQTQWIWSSNRFNIFYKYLLVPLSVVRTGLNVFKIESFFPSQAMFRFQSPIIFLF